MTTSTPGPTADVTPNRRGARSREAVLDAAERLIAAQGYEAATVAGLVKEAGIPASSIYHYFGSKEGVLLAVMERGAEQFFAELPVPDRRVGSQREHLEALVRAVAANLDRNPDFLRILVVMAAQPAHVGEGHVHRVVERVRELALQRLREQMRPRLRTRPCGRCGRSPRTVLARRLRRRLRRASIAPRRHDRRPPRAPADGADRHPARARPARTACGSVRRWVNRAKCVTTAHAGRSETPQR